MTCDEVRDQLGAYVLGALDPVERAGVEAHLRDCTSCFSEAEAYEDAAGAIALALPARRAPRELRARVLAASGAVEKVTRLSVPGRRRWLGFAAGAAAALAFAATLGWAISFQFQVNDLQDGQERIVVEHERANQQLASLSSTGDRIGAHEAALYVLFDQTARYTTLTGQGPAAAADALYAWSPSERLGVLLCQDLAPPAEGMTYHLWLRMEEGRIDGGTFRPDAQGNAQVVVGGEDGTPAPGQTRGPLRAVVVTLEPSSTEASSDASVVLSGDAAD